MTNARSPIVASLSAMLMCSAALSQSSESAPRREAAAPTARQCQLPSAKVADAILVFDSDACCTWIGGPMKVTLGADMTPSAVPSGTEMVTFVKKLSAEHDRNLRRSAILLTEGSVYRWRKTPTADFDRSALKRGQLLCSMPTSSTDDELKAMLLR